MIISVDAEKVFAKSNTHLCKTKQNKNLSKQDESRGEELSQLDKEHLQNHR